MANFVKAISTDEIQPGERAVVELDGQFIAVFRVGDQYFAIEDVCTHDEGPLGDGELEGFQVECPRHGGRFDIRTGQAVRFPAVSPVRRFEVKVEGGEVLVDIE